MAKLKNTPIALTTIKVIAIISAAVCAVGLFLTIVAILKRDASGAQALLAAIAGAVNMALFGGLYYITKAACLYIEGKESE